MEDRNVSNECLILILYRNYKPNLHTFSVEIVLIEPFTTCFGNENSILWSNKNDWSLFDQNMEFSTLKHIVIEGTDLIRTDWTEKVCKPGF